MTIYFEDGSSISFRRMNGKPKEYIPYTYLIGWTKMNKWYYGVEYRRTDRIANPANLWTIYKTSSIIVRRFYEKHGNPDVIEVRRTFREAKDAFAWEQKVLRRMNVKDREDFLNIRNNTGKISTSGKNTGKFNSNNIPWNKGITYNISQDERKKFGHVISEDERQSISKSNYIRFSNTELREEYRNTANKQFANTIFKDKHYKACISSNVNKNTVWINDGCSHKRVDETNLNNYLSIGWKCGRIISDQQKITMKMNRSVNKDPKTGRFIKQKDKT